MQISDIRVPKDFTKTTFSGYKKSDVVKALDRCLVSGSVERACFWAAELVCSGRFLDIWETLMVTYSQNCFSSAPKIAMVLSELLTSFGSLANGQYSGNELELRNVDHVRTLVAQAVASVAAAPGWDVEQCDPRGRPTLGSVWEAKGFRGFAGTVPRLA